MKKVWHRFILDFVMLVGLASLYSEHAVSLSYHEIGGLVLGGLFLLHLIFNWKWIKSVFAKLFSRGIKIRTRILCVVDVLLLLSWAMVIFSGACISKVVFSFRIMGQWKMLHFFFAALSLVLSGVHLGFHVKYFDVHLKKLIPLPATVKKIVVIVLAVAVVVVGAVNYRSSGLERWLSMPFGSSMGGGPGGPSGEMGRPSGETAQTQAASAEPEQAASAEPEQTASAEAEAEASAEPVQSASSEPEQSGSAEPAQNAGASREMGGGPSGEMGFRPQRLLALVWQFGTVVLAVMTLTGVVDGLCGWVKKYRRSKTK